MIYLNTNKKTYERLQECLPDLIPNVKIDVLMMDDNLERLGFCESAPCKIAINLNNNDRKNLLNELLYIEEIYFADESYDNCRKYEKYLWMYPIFFSAKMVD